jgi:hypothetical protein
MRNKNNLLQMNKSLFNKLPENIKSEKSETKFYKVLKSFLLLKAFYSIQEFLENKH